MKREHKIIHAVPCPVCRARRGQPCIYRTAAERATAQGRILVHGARREAWQDWRKRTPVDFYAQSGTPDVLHPQSQRAHTAALGLIEGAADQGDSIAVPNLRTAIDTLTEDGWRVE